MIKALGLGFIIEISQMIKALGLGYIIEIVSSAPGVSGLGPGASGLLLSELAHPKPLIFYVQVLGPSACVHMFRTPLNPKS